MTMATLRVDTDNVGILSSLADNLGTSEGGLTLMISLLSGYPLSLVYRWLIFGISPMYQHIFFILTGAGILWFNFGANCLYNLLSILVTYILLRILGHNRNSVIAVFIFNLAYLMVAYIVISTESYDIDWTIPQCVLTLRLIGLSFDVYDGHKAEDKLSSDQKLSRLTGDIPSLMEITSFSLFYGGSLIGPQFSLRKYREFINATPFITSQRPQLPDSVMPSVRLFMTGLLYVLLHLLISPAFPSTYLITDNFANLPYTHKCVIIAMWCRGELYKYIGCWRITEASCTLCGLSYNGIDPASKSLRWDGCKNVKLDRFETCYTFQHIIDSFNMNTNKWMASYIYKRLRFLGNKLYSQIGTLLFLAMWHGFATGYYACFFMEFITMQWDKEFVPILCGSPTLVRLYTTSHPILRGLITFLRWIFIQVMMGYCLTPFVQLTTWKYWKVWQSMNYIGLIIFLSWPVLLRPLLKWIIRTTSPKSPIDGGDATAASEKQKTN